MKKKTLHFTKKNLLQYLGMTVLFVAISALSLQFLLKQFTKGVSFDQLHIFSLNAVLSLAVLLCVYVLVDALRLYFILKALKEDISFGYTLVLTFINVFVSNITPFTIGGAFAMIYFLHKKGLPVGKAAAVTSLKSFLASSFNILLMPFAFFFMIVGTSGGDELKKAALFSPLILIGYVIFIWALFKVLKHRRRLHEIIYRFYKALYSRKIISSHRFYKLYSVTSKQVDHFASNFRMFFSGLPKYISLTFLVTILYYIILYMFSAVMAKDLSLKVSILEVMSTQAIATFIMYFGFTPGGSGIAEGSYLLLFSKFITSDVILAALTFYWRLFTVYISTAIGGIFFMIQIFIIQHKTKSQKSS